MMRVSTAQRVEETDSAVEALRDAVLSVQSQAQQQQLLEKQRGRHISAAPAARELSTSGQGQGAQATADAEHQQLRRYATFNAGNMQPWTATNAAGQRQSITRRLSSAVGLPGLFAESTSAPRSSAAPPAPRSAPDWKPERRPVPLSASTAHRAALASLMMPSPGLLDAQISQPPADLAAARASAVQGSRMRAAWDYTAAAPDELSFKAGDMFLVVGPQPEDLDLGWIAVEVEGRGEEESAWLGEAGANTRQRGIVPLTHVHVASRPGDIEMGPTVSSPQAVAPPASAPVSNSSPGDQLEHLGPGGASDQDGTVAAFQLPSSAPEAQLGYVSPWMGKDREGEGGRFEHSVATGMGVAANEASFDRKSAPGAVVGSEPSLNPPDSGVNEEGAAELRMSPVGDEAAAKAKREEQAAKVERERLQVDQAQRRLQVRGEEAGRQRGVEGGKQGGSEAERGQTHIET
jgi:hypothetical protein